MSAPDISVVVPSYGRPAALARLLAALSAQTLGRERFEVVVVDDGSEAPLAPATEPFAARLQLLTLRQENAGPGPARQLGCERARGAWLAFTDDDCEPAPDWLERMLLALRANPGCAVSGATINGLVDCVFAEATHVLLDRLMGQLALGTHGPAFFPTNNVGFEAAAFRACGGFDTEWPVAGGEDRDLCRRFLAAGGRLHREPSAVVVHRHVMGLRGFLRQHFNYGRGSFLFHAAERRLGRSGFAAPSFYLALLGLRDAAPGSHPSARVSALLGVSQLATCAGYLAEAVRSRTR